MRSLVSAAFSSCSILASSLYAPVKLVPLSEYTLAGHPLLAANLEREARKASEVRSDTNSMNCLGGKANINANICFNQSGLPQLSPFAEKRPSKVQPHDREGWSCLHTVSRELSHHLVGCSCVGLLAENA